MMSYERGSSLDLFPLWPKLILQLCEQYRIRPW